MSDGAAGRFAIAVGRFYEELAERLVAGARAELEAAGAAGIDVLDVPGAFELPLAAAYAARSGRCGSLGCCPSHLPSSSFGCPARRFCVACNNFTRATAR